MKRKLQSLSCIIPALNEYDNLQILIPEIKKTLSDIKGLELKIIIVDDGSTDQTPEIFNIFKDKVNLQYIQLSRNFGKEAAIAAGLQVANTQASVILDADMQHPPRLILTMIEEWENGYDMVYTYRQQRKDESFIKRFGTSIFYNLLLDSKMPRNAGDFRLMDVKVIQALNHLPERRRFSKGLYHWVGFSTKAIPYTPEPRHSGKSRFNFLKLLVLAIDGVTSFSVKPLRITLIIGLILSIFGFGYMFWLIIAYFIWSTIKGFTTIVVLICALFGMLFIILGVIGEYIAKIFEETKQRPIFIVQQNLLSEDLLNQYSTFASTDLSKCEHCSQPQQCYANHMSNTSKGLNTESISENEKKSQ